MARWHVHLAGRQKVAWALDEDLSWIRSSLGRACRWTMAPFARIIHAAWPAAILEIPPHALYGRKIVCQADNPPAFYLGTEGFPKASGLVDLWIARTSEAEEQFRLLDLPVARVPYCVDPNVFRPLPHREEIRRSLGISAGAFVIGNFHRDSEGRDLRRPKLQKGPDVFLRIARDLRERVPETVVLLAGPRRHWLRNALGAERIPAIFAGKEHGQSDDYPSNIVSRARLNELYQALDVCVVSSRWEGGPYAVLESLAAGCPVISSPVGTSRDVLPDSCMFNTSARAVELLVAASRDSGLKETCATAAANAAVTHNPASVAQALERIYDRLPTGLPTPAAMMRSCAALLAGTRRAEANPAMTFPQDFRLPFSQRCEDIEHFDGRYCRSRAELFQLASRIAALRDTVP